MNNESKEKVLIITAVDGERDAVLRGLQGAGGFDVLAVGVGPAAAAAGTARAIAARGYSLVLNAGIAGGFVGQAEVGSVVIASEIVAADLGAESPEGFQSLEALGFGSSRIIPDSGHVGKLARSLQQAGCRTVVGPVLTLTTITGTAAKAEQLAIRVPGAAAEAMEGYGVAVAARDAGIPVMEIRTISNPVGPRDRSAWRIKEALEALEKASSILPEVLR